MPNPSTQDISHRRLASNRHCVFRCGTSWFSLPAVAIREVTVAPRPVRVPESPAWLEGIVQLHSEFLPVISLRRFLDLDFDSSAGDSRGERLLVINGNPVWSLRVCEVAALSEVDATLSPGTDPFANQPTGVVGTFTWGNEVARVLEPHHTLAQIQKALNRLWSAPQAAGASQSGTNPLNSHEANAL